MYSNHPEHQTNTPNWILDEAEKNMMARFPEMSLEVANDVLAFEINQEIRSYMEKAIASAVRDGRSHLTEEETKYIREHA